MTWWAGDAPASPPAWQTWLPTLIGVVLAAVVTAVGTIVVKRLNRRLDEATTVKTETRSNDLREVGAVVRQQAEAIRNLPPENVDVELVAAAGGEVHVHDAHRLRAGERRAAHPARHAPVGLLAHDVRVRDEPAAHGCPPMGIDLNRCMFWVMATSVGSRSIELAP